MRDAAETLALSAPIGICRDMAAQAEKLAASAATPERRAKFLDLARQWTELADEMERAVSMFDRVRAAAE
jgi:uncharacterized protein Yka (UPF0111/DUF47 family)